MNSHPAMDSDIVFDATGNHAAMERGFDFVAHGGRYVFVSVIKDAITFPDPTFIAKSCRSMQAATPPPKTSSR